MMEKVVLPKEKGDYRFLILSYDDELYLRCGERNRSNWFIAKDFLEEVGEIDQEADSLDDHIRDSGLLCVFEKAGIVCFIWDKGNEDKEVINSVMEGSGYNLKFYGYYDC